MSTAPIDRFRQRRRLIITLAITATVVIVLAAVGIYGLITGPDTSSSDPGSDPTITQEPQEPGADPGEAELAPLPRTNDAERYARAVALALFDWDTFTLLTPADHQAILIEDADPSGTETPGLIADLDGYLPSASTWRDLAEYRTRQHLEIDRIYVPEQWDEAVAASAGQIAEGTIAYTIEGTRHREGIWYDDPVASAHPVAFTVFLSCEPVFDRCHVLRLSQLDNPLR